EPAAEPVPEAGAEPIAEPIAEPAVEPIAEAGEAEEALMAEIMRLLAERDSLYEEINELRAENLALAQAADEAEYYRLRTGELESELERLEAELAAKEAELAAKEAELADADARLDAIGAQLAEEGARLADAEARLALVELDDDALGAALIEKDALLAEKDALLSEKDASLAEKDATIAEKDASLAEKDALLVERDASVAELDARIASLDSELAEARAALAEAESKLYESTERAAPVATVAPTAAPVRDDGGEASAATIAALEARVAELSAERDAAVATRDAAVATRDASDAMRLATERILDETKAELERALADAKASGAIVAAPVPAATPGPSTVARPAPSGGYLSGWAIDSSRFTRSLRSGFDGSAARMGAWKLAGQVASQTDPKQYFSRLEMPLAQGQAATLYRFKARSTGDGWVGVGLHLYVEDVKKRHGYGEGRSLLVWFTRDRAARGDDATYLQLYRSDDDVVMERMFDAELSDGIEAWRTVEVLYDPAAEFIAVSVDGVLRIVYKTFFGRDSGATVSLRTLGAGGSFSDFSAWAE
ncbi:MAG TPA: hypothetical protein PK179_05025, partial [Spirochaetales bacterium]|nr:hypothetical protein [Spirochaetales bacterium]